MSRRQDTHPTELMSAFLSKSLSRTESREIQLHLSSCQDCRNRLLRIQIGMEAASELHRVCAPSELWERLQEKLHPRPRTFGRKWVPIAALLLIALAVSLLFVPRKGAAPQQRWRLESVQGLVRINGQAASEDQEIAAGAELKTGMNSEARLAIESVGEVIVSPGSSISLKESAARHRLALHGGRLVASIWAPPRVFLVETQAAVAVDLGCSYELEFDERLQTGRLKVTSGWVLLQKDGLEVSVAAGMSCSIEAPEGPGVPYLSDQSDGFAEAVRRLARGGGSDADLQTVLNEQDRRNALTLFHLAERMGESDQRSALIEKLTDWVPPPKPFQRREGLDPTEIEKWHELIQEVSLGFSRDEAARAVAGSVKKLPDLMVPRAAHSATRLADGSLLIAGGWTSGETPIRSAEIYLPQQGRFTALKGLNEARAHHTASPLPDGRILLAGGYGVGGWLKTSELFDPKTQRFLPGPSLNTARSAHRATLLADGRILFSGGRGIGGDALRGAEMLNPETMQFEQLPAMAVPREGHTATRLNDGRVLIAGGRSRIVEVFLPDENRFQTLESGLRAPRYKGGAALLNDGRVLILGGMDGRELSREVEVFSPQTNELTVFNTLNLGRFKVTDAVLSQPDGRVVIAGGHARLEVFDPKRRQFDFLPFSLKRPHFYSTATVLRSGQILILGGYTHRLKPTPDAWLVDLQPSDGGR